MFDLHAFDYLKKVCEIERDESRRRWQEHNFREMRGNMSNYESIVRSGPGQAYGIWQNYAARAEAIKNDHRLPAYGKEVELQAAKDAALNELANLQAKVEIAGKALEGQREAKLGRSLPDVDEFDRTERYLMYLADRGVKVDDLISRNADDPQALAVLWQLAPVLAQAENASDPEAADGLRERLIQVGLETFGVDFKEAYENVRAAKDQAYYSKMSVNECLNAVKTDSEPLIVNVDGQVTHGVSA